MEDLAAALAAAIGSQNNAANTATSLQAALPSALFVRASVRSGHGLFVTDDLLRAGSLELSVASLQNSLGGIAMVQERPVVVSLPSGLAAPATSHVLCVPVALQPAASQRSSSSSMAATMTAARAGAAPLYVGALMAGCSSAVGPPPHLLGQLEALAAAAAPYFLLLAATKADEMAAMLKLRAADCTCCPEDQRRDSPPEACTQPPPHPGSVGASGPTPAIAGGVGRSEATAALQALQAAAEAGPLRLTAALGTSAATDGRSSGSMAAATPRWACLASRNVFGTESSDSDGSPEREADPKSHLRKPQQPPPPAVAAARRCRGSLLRFADPALEACFAEAHNAALRRSDAAFAALHLAAGLSCAAVRPAALLASPAALALVGATAAALLCMAAAPARYLRHREALLAALLLLHAALLRWAPLPLPAGALPGLGGALLPWLLRATGCEALALFSLGFKLRFCVFLPVQALCLAVVLPALQAGCPAASAAAQDACLPSDISRAGMAVVLCLGGLLPAVAIAFFESRARRRFEATLALRG